MFYVLEKNVFFFRSETFAIKNLNRRLILDKKSQNFSKFVLDIETVS